MILSLMASLRQHIGVEEVVAPAHERVEGEHCLVEKGSLLQVLHDTNQRLNLLTFHQKLER